MVEEIAERLAAVKKRIRSASREAGRTEDAVRLVAVSKTQPVSAIEAAYAAGQRDFGENYAQELAEKASALAHLPELRWHMLGHLQTNKVRHVCPLMTSLHSLDSERLATVLDRRLAGRTASEGNRKLAVLLQVNLGREAQKHGIAPGDIEALAKSCERLPRLRLSGLMVIPPRTEDSQATRAYFEELRRLRDECGGKQRLPELSMGMTDDFEEAIRAGATIVRVGTAIFGPRATQPPASEGGRFTA